MSKNNPNTHKNNSSRGEGRSWPIDPDFILSMLMILGLTPKMMFDGIYKLRLKDGRNGPDYGNIRRTLRQGYASHEVYSDMLKYLRMKILEAHEIHFLTPDELPMILRLDRKPDDDVRKAS